MSNMKKTEIDQLVAAVLERLAIGGGGAKGGVQESGLSPLMGSGVGSWDGARGVLSIPDTLVKLGEHCVSSGGSSFSSAVSWADIQEEEEEKKVKQSGAGSGGIGGDGEAAAGVELGSGAADASVVEKVPDHGDKQSEGKGVVMPKGYGPVGKCQGLVFGGKDETGNFFSNFVRVPEVRALNEVLRWMGVAVPKVWLEELALARYAQGSVPDAFACGKERLKVLSKVGDNAMTLALSDAMYGKRCSVAEVQGQCAKVLSASALSRLCVQSGLAKHVVCPSGIDLATAKPAGEALEAFAGVVYHSKGMDGVAQFMRALHIM